jgi:methylglutaconyl-CoA hydratase
VIKAIGERAANRYFLTAEKFTAIDAQKMGLVHIVTESADLLSSANEIIKQLLANSSEAIKISKKLIKHIAARPLDESLIQTTIECIAEVRTSEAAQGRLKEFLNKF